QPSGHGRRPDAGYCTKARHERLTVYRHRPAWRRHTMTEHASDLFPAGAPPPGAYTLDPERTTIRADVKAMFGLLTVHGTFRLEAGQVSIATDPGASSVQASIAAGSFASGHAKR